VIVTLRGSLQAVIAQRQSIEQLLPKFETEETAFERQAEIIQALQGQDPTSAKRAKRAAKLEHKLTECANGSPCNLSMCPVCVHGLRASFVLAATACIDKLRSTKWGPRLPITAFSAVHVCDQYLLGKLAQMDVPLINRRVQRQHQRARFPLVFAGIDLSWDEYIPPRKPPFWQGHIYGVVVGLDVEAVKSAVKHLYPRAASIPRPFQASECSDLPEALSYIIKPGFVKFVRYIDCPRRRPKKPWLRGPLLREMALSLGTYELSVRYTLTGCRFYTDRIDLNRGVRKRLKALALGMTNGPI
jgi:hypothetical protein